LCPKQKEENLDRFVRNHFFLLFSQPVPDRGRARRGTGFLGFQKQTAEKLPTRGKKFDYDG
jgi:hypothetical protein